MAEPTPGPQEPPGSAAAVAGNGEPTISQVMNGRLSIPHGLPKTAQAVLWDIQRNGNSLQASQLSHLLAEAIEVSSRANVPLPKSTSNHHEKDKQLAEEMDKVAEQGFLHAFRIEPRLAHAVERSAEGGTAGKTQGAERAGWALTQARDGWPLQAVHAAQKLRKEQTRQGRQTPATGTGRATGSSANTTRDATFESKGVARSLDPKRAF